MYNIRNILYAIFKNDKLRERFINSISSAELRNFTYTYLNWYLSWIHIFLKCNTSPYNGDPNIFVPLVSEFAAFLNKFIIDNKSDILALYEINIDSETFDSLFNDKSVYNLSTSLALLYLGKDTVVIKI